MLQQGHRLAMSYLQQQSIQELDAIYPKEEVNGEVEDDGAGIHRPG